MTIRARAIALAKQGVRPVEIAAGLGVRAQSVNEALWKARRAGVSLPCFPTGPVPKPKPPRTPTMAERALAMAREEPTPSLAEIAARLGTTKASVTEVLGRARRRGEAVPVFAGGRPRRCEGT